MVALALALALVSEVAAGGVGEGVGEGDCVPDRPGGVDRNQSQLHDFFIIVSLFLFFFFGGDLISHPNPNVEFPK